MTDEPSGAVDRTHDDAERDARDQIQSKLREWPTELEGGDLAIDMVKDRPLFIRRKVADSAVGYFEREDFDLTTYKAHKWLPVTPDDAVFECVFIPTRLQDLPSSKGSKTYDYPRGRLARVPVEWLWDSYTRFQDDMLAATLAALFTESVDHKVVATAVETFGDVAVDDAFARAGIDGRHE